MAPTTAAAKSLTVKELKTLMKERNIPCKATYKKADMEAALAATPVPKAAPKAKEATLKELQAQLKAQGIPYSSKAKKATLAVLLADETAAAAAKAAADVKTAAKEASKAKKAQEATAKAAKKAALPPRPTKDYRYEAFTLAQLKGFIAARFKGQVSPYGRKAKVAYALQCAATAAGITIDQLCTLPLQA